MTKPDKTQGLVVKRGRSNSPEIKKIRIAEHENGKRSEPSSANVKKIFYHEEYFAQNLSFDINEELETTCCRIRELIIEVCAFKNDGKPEGEYAESKREMLQKLGTLRKLNRLAHMREKAARDKTRVVKESIDEKHLELQNLLYEIVHLQKEITRCLQFNSKHQDINLITKDEFYEKAPTDISLPEKTKIDDHQQMLARLHFELVQRKELEEKLRASNVEKAKVINHLQKEKDRLNMLQPILQDALDATKPVQEVLKMPMEEAHHQMKMAACLPGPLYIIFMHLVAFQDAHTKEKLEVVIEGDLELSRSVDTTILEVEDSDSDLEEKDAKDCKKRRMKASPAEKRKSLREKILKTHALCVSLILKCGPVDGRFKINFNFLTAFGIVTVTSKALEGNIANEEITLSEIFPGDTGLSSPNPANHFLLMNVKIDNFEEVVPIVGYAYSWAQKLGGLQFVGCKEIESRQMTSEAASFTELTYRKLQKRVQSQLVLIDHLSKLAQCQIPLLAPNLFPNDTEASLAAWKSSTLQDFKHEPWTLSWLHSGLVSEQDQFFEGCVSVAKEQVRFFVVIKSDYPNVSPFIILDDSKSRSSFDIQAQLNLYSSDIADHSLCDLLPLMLKRLLILCELHLKMVDCSSNLLVIPRKFRGKDRCLPLNFNSTYNYFGHNAC